MKGGNDSLTLGINNMPEYVTVNGNGIEHVTVNSTGDVENYVWLKGMDGAKSVKITGDGEANVALSPTVTTIDATEAGADTFVCTRYSDLVESIRMGKGDDSFTLRSITPNAVVDGGDGQDTGKLYNTSGAYQLQMSNVETLNITVGKTMPVRRLRIRRLRFLLTAVLQPAWKHWGLPAATVMLLMAQPPRPDQSPCPITMWAS